MSILDEVKKYIRFDEDKPTDNFRDEYVRAGLPSVPETIKSASKMYELLKRTADRMALQNKEKERNAMYDLKWWYENLIRDKFDKDSGLFNRNGGINRISGENPEDVERLVKTRGKWIDQPMNGSMSPVETATALTMFNQYKKSLSERKQKYDMLKNADEIGLSALKTYGCKGFENDLNEGRDFNMKKIMKSFDREQEELSGIGLPLLEELGEDAPVYLGKQYPLYPLGDQSIDEFVPEKPYMVHTSNDAGVWWRVNPLNPSGNRKGEYWKMSDKYNYVPYTIRDWFYERGSGSWYEWFKDKYRREHEK